MRNCYERYKKKFGINKMLSQNVIFHDEVKLPRDRTYCNTYNGFPIIIVCSYRCFILTCSTYIRFYNG